MTQILFAEPDEADIDHLMFSDDTVISAFARWLVMESGPDDWHRVVLGWNWDRGEDPIWWIVTRRTCDRATALLVFWKTKPMEGFGHPGWEAAEGDDDDLHRTIRARWAAGFYTRSDIAFDADRDVHRLDFAADDHGFGIALDPVVPADMRRVEGRRLTDTGYIEGMPARFWDMEENDRDFDEDGDEV